MTELRDYHIPRPQPGTTKSCPTFEKPEDVDRVLGTFFGIDREMVVAAVCAGLRDGAQATQDSSIMSANWRAWDGTVQSIRASLGTCGYKRHPLKNVPAAVCEERRVKIVVHGGDEGTGIPNANPKTKSHKGSSAKSDVARNKAHHPQFDFDPYGYESPNEQALREKKELQTWVLLVHYDCKNGKAWVELSRPTGFEAPGARKRWDGRRKIDKWDARIILGEVTLEQHDEGSAASEPEPVEFEMDPRLDSGA
jgi:hypothetical protein